MEIRFAVQSEYFSLYQALREEAEKCGWSYNSEFNEFDEDKMSHCDCLFFSSDWHGEGACFSFSNGGPGKKYVLPEQWGQTIAAIKSVSRDFGKKKQIVNVTFDEIANWKGVQPEQIRIYKY